ncbi:MAG: hypothetical protein PVH25_03910 [Burkholderiales bacterium]|jgi:hypothetical protein
MFIRSIVLMIAVWLAFGGNVVQAKVAPAPNTVGDFGQRLEQQFEERLDNRKFCDLGVALQSEGAIQARSHEPFAAISDFSCLLPAPIADPFGNVARL